MFFDCPIFDKILKLAKNIYREDSFNYFNILNEQNYMKYQFISVLEMKGLYALKNNDWPEISLNLELIK